jgi:predicted nuclease of predicted toxin-antitoxin system
MRFLIDMNLSPRWVEFLAAAGHDAVHWSTVGAPNASDRELIDHAIAERRVIVTQDLDFGTILAVGGLDGPSVVQFRTQAVLPDSAGPGLLSAVAVAQEHLNAGALVTVDTSGHRVSILPMRP